MFSGKLSTQSCVLCGHDHDTLEVKFKDKPFAGVVCVAHLLQLLRGNGEKLTNLDSRPGSAKTA